MLRSALNRGIRQISLWFLVVVNSHLSVLIESMRREGFELGVSRPEVIVREVDGVKEEPYEYVAIDIEDQHQGAVMEEMGPKG